MQQNNHRHPEPEQRFQRLMPEDHHPKVRAYRAPCHGQPQQHPFRDPPPVVDSFQLVQAVDEKSYDIDDDKRIDSHENIFIFTENVFYNSSPSSRSATFTNGSVTSYDTRNERMYSANGLFSQ